MQSKLARQITAGGLMLIALATGNFSCKKDAAKQPVDSVQSAINNEKSIAERIDRVTGTYDASGKRTPYVGPRSNNVIAYVIPIQDYAPTKTVAALNGKTITCDYADLGVSGWQYVITGHKDSSFTVAPNATMLAGIAEGSFVVLSATFDPPTKTFHLVTGYTNTIGNDRTIDEVLVRQLAK